MTKETLMLVKAAWPAPQNIQAGTTTRYGGVSEFPFDTFNLADNVGDNKAHVLANRKRLADYLQVQSPLIWMQQVHGTKVINVNNELEQTPEADAQYSHIPGTVCGVKTADCMPVLLCNEQGTEIAAAHAGWRGLAAGVLAETVSTFKSPSAELMAWLGPAIGKQSFEVGSDVQHAFIQSLGDSAALRQAFTPIQNTQHKFYADLYALARIGLQQLGVTAVYGEQQCTYQQDNKFFSYRRDNITGRMFSFISMG